MAVLPQSLQMGSQTSQCYGVIVAMKMPHYIAEAAPKCVNWRWMEMEKQTMKVPPCLLSASVLSIANEAANASIHISNMVCT